MDYLVVIERDDKGCSAYVPDLPGCIALGDTVEQVQELIKEAIDAHIESLREQGESVPPPTTQATIVRAA